jgi:hypothetical protein
MALRLFTSRLLSAGQRSVTLIQPVLISGIDAVDINSVYLCNSRRRLVDIETALTYAIRCF